MHDRPDPAELLDGVLRFLRESASPQLKGTAAHEARIAIRLLEIVRRQGQMAPESDAAELKSLQALLGDDSSNAKTLNQRLAERIASGLFDSGEAATRLQDHLWMTTLAKLAVDQPDHATFRRVASRRIATAAARTRDAS